jgi:DNA-binding transcriptional LysR family regulator
MHRPRPRMPTRNEGFDVAVWVGELPDSSLIARQLAPCRMVVCGAPSYFDKHGKPRTPADLTAHNCLSVAGMRPQRARAASTAAARNSTSLQKSRLVEEAARDPGDWISATPPRHSGIQGVRFAADSALEGTGFEPSVPGR